MRNTGIPWTPEGFDECIERWDALEHPPDELRSWVVEWIFSRLEDPYQDVKRAAGFPNLWWGQLPGTLHGDGMVVVCNYWVVESAHVVRCESIASLSWPV